MKKYANLKHRPFEFEVGEWVWLRLQPYRQNSVLCRSCLKLAKRFYGPFLIEAKISVVAYRLKLPPYCTIYPMFHITLLKAYHGTPLDQVVNPLSPLAANSHPIIFPAKMVAYRQIK